MAPRRIRLIAIPVAVAVAAIAGGYALYLSAQATPPQLAQAPMNVTNVIPPAFIMGMDDSRSMVYQSVFPTQDTQGLAGGGGGACWSGNSNTATDASWSFFSGPNQLRLDRVSSRGTCAYFYYITGTRDLNNNGVPPIDAYGFARSHVYSYNYYNPGVVYTPWARGNGTNYPASTPTAAKLDPHAAATVDLTQNLSDANDRSLFYAHLGMRLPAGLRYRLQSNNDCGGLTGGGQWRTVAAAGNTMSASCQMYIQYYPATFYLRTDTAPELPGSPGAYAGITPTEVPNACGTGCSLWRYQISAANTVAMQNFANWFTYYNNRQRAAIASASHALADVNNMRVGYFTINNRINVTMYDMADVTQKTALYGTGASPGENTILGMLADGGATPNTNAVNHMGQQFQRSPATGAAANTVPVVSACQKNAGMLFTDGFNNDSNAPNAPAITGLGVPFDTTGANTMAAIASRYYFNMGANTIGPPGASPLRTGTGFPAGKVPTPDQCDTPDPTNMDWKRLDCQTNLHMNFYAITMGARGVAFNPDANPVQDPFVTPVTWPATAPANNTNATVDDLWHATVNTRGEFINADSPDAITAAMRRILAAVGSGATPAGTLTVTGSRIGTGSLVVEPRYESTNNGTDWHGKLNAYSVSVNALTSVATFTDAWEASVKLGAQGASGRTIRYGTTSSSVVPTVQDFTAATLTLDSLCATADPLKTGACTSADIAALAGGTMNINRAVAYLRGDRADEGALRVRSSILGDIVNSSPVIAADTDDYGYRAMAGSLGASYATYLASKQTAARPVVLVGANDGMLHVFDGRAGAAGGNELFAYIPATSLGHMGGLLFPYVAADQNDQDFKHRYFVDGQIAVSDVNIGGVWKTVAVVASGAGGRSVFALDITNPSAITVLWEINDRITGNTAITSNVGYVLGQPVIVPFKNTAGTVSWKAIFGNGYNSTSQQASLFVVDVATGAASSIVASEVPALPYNGLGNVSVVDTKQRNIANDAWINGRDGFADTVYAADQNGAVWKFDLLSNSVALGGAPLFVARDSSGTRRQAITGGITTATGPSGGVMVYFGTGSFVFTGDPLDNSVQTMYGVLDRGVAVSGRGSLQQQAVGTDAGGFRATTNYSLGAGMYGWYIDLPAGERIVGSPRIDSGVVFFPAYAPSATSTDDCSVTGTNWLYGLNALSGGAAMTYVRMGSPTGTQPSSTTGAVALNTGGSAPVKDVGVMTAPRVSPLAPGAAQADINAALAAQCSMVVRVAGAQPMYLPRPCGRQSWRQVR